MSRLPPAWGARRRAAARWVKAYWQALEAGREVCLLRRWPFNLPCRQGQQTRLF